MAMYVCIYYEVIFPLQTRVRCRTPGLSAVRPLLNLQPNPTASIAMHGGVEEDEPIAFAKLWGQLDASPFHCYVTSLPSTLGRASAATEGTSKDGFINLGRSKALSREHGELQYIQ